jgi:hypothetical protein
MMMPSLPGTNLVLVHARLAFASLKAGFNADARFDHPCQFPKRRVAGKSVLIPSTA